MFVHSDAAAKEAECSKKLLDVVTEVEIVRRESWPLQSAKRKSIVGIYASSCCLLKSEIYELTRQRNYGAVVPTFCRVYLYRLSGFTCCSWFPETQMNY